MLLWCVLNVNVTLPAEEASQRTENRVEFVWIPQNPFACLYRWFNGSDLREKGLAENDRETL